MILISSMAGTRPVKMFSVALKHVRFFSFFLYLLIIYKNRGERRSGLMVCALDSGREVLVQALVGVTALCSWARQFTLIVPLSTQVYKWVPANKCWG